MTYDVFISYASHDHRQIETVGTKQIEIPVNEKVEQFVESIRSFGYSAFWHHDSASAVLQLDEQIDCVIDEAFCLIVLLSRASLASPWVKTEVTKAFAQGKLLPVLLEANVHETVRNKILYNVFIPVPIFDWNGKPESLDPRIREDIERLRTRAKK